MTATYLKDATNLYMPSSPTAAVLVNNSLGVTEISDAPVSIKSKNTGLRTMIKSIGC